jgi:hypothetical protein
VFTTRSIEPFSSKSFTSTPRAARAAAAWARHDTTRRRPTDRGCCGRVVPDLATTPNGILEAIAPNREGLVVAGECIFTWQ